MIVDMLPIAQKRTKNSSEIQSTFSQVFEILLLNKKTVLIAIMMKKTRFIISDNLITPNFKLNSLYNDS